VANIRPLEREDVPAVARLLREHLPGWSRDSRALERILVDHPWASPPLRSLVAVDEDGTVIGSLGAQDRRVRFGDRDLAGVAISHLVVSPERRAGAAGVMLVRELLSGGADLTWTDSGTARALRIWRAVGGHLDHSRVADWMLVLNPARWLRGLASVKLARRTVNRHALPVAALPFASIAHPRASSAGADGYTGEDIDSASLAGQVDQLPGRIDLRVAHDRASLDAAFDHLSALGDRVVCRLVRREGRPVGWYAYLLRPMASRTLCVAAPEAEADAVLGDLVADARRRGSAVISGRLEPQLDQAIRDLPAVLGLGQQPIIHARDPDVLQAVGSAGSLLTELDLIDCEWW
jgi:hypothetical protein